jgi:hypothetical protein
MRAKKMKIFVWLIAAPTFLFICICSYSSWKTKRDAARFYKDALNLELGNATPDDVLKLARSTHGKLLLFQPCLSGGGNCVGIVYFENLWLHRLHVAPATVFGCRFTFRNYKLQNRWIRMESGASASVPDWGAFVNEGISRDVYPAPVEITPEQKYLRIIQGFPLGYVGVWITPDTPADLRKLAYNFNFGCLTKLGGCKTVEEMLPILSRKDLYRDPGKPWLHEKASN